MKGLKLPKQCLMMWNNSNRGGDGSVDTNNGYIGIYQQLIIFMDQFLVSLASSHLNNCTQD